MSHNYDNWEKLVDAVMLKLHYLELCALSETSSECSSSIPSLGSPPRERPPRGWLPQMTSVASGAIRRWFPRRPGQFESNIGRHRSKSNPSIRIVPSDSFQSQPRIDAAEWPSWLTSVVGEALSDWVPKRADTFEKLGKIGQGKYSNVYLARNLVDGRLVALKKIKFDALEAKSIRFMAREILILRQLNHPNIIKLEGIITSGMSSSLYLIFEYRELDLARILSYPNLKLKELQIQCYMHQLLCGVEYFHCHGILHRDLKGSDLLIDNNGNLKIADFGLASFFGPEQNQPMTSHVVSLCYRAPELLLGSSYYGAGVDLWSIGCILAECYAGKPIMRGRTEVDQLRKIFKLCGSPSEEYWKKLKLPHTTVFKPTHLYRRRFAETFKDFPAPVLALLEILLAIDPADRGSAASALESEYFTTFRHSCAPSSFRKYPSRIGIDAEIQEERAFWLARHDSGLKEWELWVEGS